MAELNPILKEYLAKVPLPLRKASEMALVAIARKTETEANEWIKVALFDRAEAYHQAFLAMTAEERISQMGLITEVWSAANVDSYEQASAQRDVVRTILEALLAIALKSVLL